MKNLIELFQKDLLEAGLEFSNPDIEKELLSILLTNANIRQSIARALRHEIKTVLQLEKYNKEESERRKIIGFTIDIEMDNLINFQTYHDSSVGIH